MCACGKNKNRENLLLYQVFYDEVKYDIKNSLTYKLMILFTRTVIFKIYMMYIITRR